MKKHLQLLAWVLSLAMLCQMLPFAAFAETDLSTNAADTATTEKSIPDDAIQFNGNHYKFYGIQDVTSNSTATWEVASQFCQNKGGHLAVICSQEENDFLFQQMKSLGYNNALFGFSDKEVEGTWKWVNGTQSSYTNWHYGEPNHQGSYEHYAMFYEKYADGTWNDGSGIIDRNCVFICEWDDSSLVASGVCGDNLTWSLSNDGTLTISGTGDMYDFSILTYLPSGPAVNTPWYTFRNDIKNVVVNDGATHIGKIAFLNCSNLYSVILPDTVSSIGSSAFSNCYSLVSINIPTSVVSIDSQTFSQCRSLTTLSLPDSITSIGFYAFSGCNFTSLTLPDSVSTIGRGAFERCTSLVSIFIPSSVSSIEYAAFSTCSSLKDVYYSGSKEQWNTISIGDANDSLLNATIHYQSTGPEDEKEFTFGRDNPSFLNQAKYFFQGSELNYWNQKYNSGRPISFTDRFFHHFNQYASIHLSQEKFNQLTKNLSPAALQWFKLKMRSGDLWGGSCYGMVLVSAIHYMDPDRLSYAQLASTGLAADSATYSLPAPVDNSDVEDLINYYYSSQLLPTQYKILSNCLYNCANDYDGVLNEIVTSLSHGIPVIASLSNHEIMLLHVKAELDDHYVLGIYDPNEATEQTLLLYKSPYIDADGDGYLNINYKDNQTQLQSYTLASDLDYIDVRNYFNPSIDHETATDYNDAHITIQAGGSVNVVHGGQYYYRAENGKLIEKSPDVHLFYPSNVSDENPSNDSVDLIFPKPSTTEDVKLVLSSDGVNDASMILNNSTLAVSASGPVSLTYNEEARSVDVTAETPTDVNVLMTQNNTTTEWPWNSWAIDTTGTTEFHAELKDDGLHLSGDGIANAKVGTENMDSEKTDTITLPAKAEGSDALEVTITNKKDSTDNDRLTINGSEPSEPTDPKPDKPSSPSTPAAPSGGSGDGDGSGAGALLLVGAGAAAAAITAGVVLSMPVEVQGKAELSDHTALPGAKISLLQDGKVVEQTTADDAGAFALKVKRGNYQLTAAYTDANGQIIHQTIDIKAPAKDLVVTF